MTTEALTAIRAAQHNLQRYEPTPEGMKESPVGWWMMANHVEALLAEKDRQIAALTPTVEKVETPAQGSPAPETHMTGWQDISTAPKNTKVLAAYRNEAGKWRTVTACYHTQLDWSDEYGDHEQEYAPEDWYEENDSSEVIYPCRCKPTHWQPLPAPPATTEGQP